jgi:transcription antitermination factor NusG
MTAPRRERRPRDNGPAWYIVHTGPQLESRASRNLSQAGYYTFYPFERVRRKRRRGNHVVVEWVERPYLNRYLFVCLRYADESFAAIEQVDGVSIVVRTRIGKVPIEVPEPVMTVVMNKSMVRLGENGRNRILGLIRELVEDDGRTLVMAQDGQGRRRIGIVDRAARPVRGG